MTASSTARVTLVHPRSIPLSLPRHVDALAGQECVWQEYRSSAGHVLRTTVTGVDTETLRSDIAGVAVAVAVDAAVVSGPLAEGVRLVVSDADSTFFRGEVIDELAAAAGSGAQVARLTLAAMEGKLDFEAALRARVATLEGLDSAVLDEVAARMQPSPGAVELLRRVHGAGAKLGIVSGGFTEILAPVQQRLGFDLLAANRLEVCDGKLTGMLAGPVVDAYAKAAHLRRWAEVLGADLSRTAAVGDGANDLAMIAEAGLGVAYEAKPVTAERADAVITSPRLDVLAEFLDLPLA